MFKHSFNADSSELIWELVSSTSMFRKRDTYCICFPNSFMNLDISASMETLSSLCYDDFLVSNFYISIHKCELVCFDPLSFKDGNKIVELCGNNCVRLLENDTLCYELNARDPNSFGRIQSFLRGY